MTGRVAETLQRRWLAFEINETYLQASKFRFEADSPLVVKPLSPEKSVKQRERKNKAIYVDKKYKKED